MANKAPINNKKKEKQQPKVSHLHKPENQTLEEWQIALRQQAATKEYFAIFENHAADTPGYYTVQNAKTNREYDVVFRGDNNPCNYCSCMDFKTSQLGTCKHLEAVRLWIKEKRKKVHTELPSHTSIQLSYRRGRRMCLIIGTEHQNEFKQLAKPYFTLTGELRKDAEEHITEFISAATRLDNTFRIHQDAITYLIEKRSYRHRKSILDSLTDKDFNELLKVSLYPYQKEGIRFAFQAGKAIIADEMGLGKTIQAIGAAELMKRNSLISSVLVVCPTSLKYQWKKEIEKFTNSTSIVIEGNHLARKRLYESEEFYKIVSYNSINNDIRILKSLHTDLLIMDEVQRLKNWDTQISRSARRIETEYSIVLSGTPLENKLEELYSVMQFVDQFCLGPYYKFIDKTVVTSQTGKVIGYKNLNSIGDKLKHVLIRRRKCDVSLELPARQDKTLFVPMTKEQRTLHDEYQYQVSILVQKWSRYRFLSEKDRRRLLLFLNEMRMVCDSTYILDQKTRNDTKVEEVMNILKNVFESGNEKVVVFSQWERMTRLIATELDKLGVHYEYLHGGIPSSKRKNLIQGFTENPESRVFISTDAGSTGLNLQAASILINIDLPWNPAILEQRIARIYRIGQPRNIQVINMVASQTIEERMLTTLNFKTSLFEGILDNGADTIFLENSKLDKIIDSIKEVVETNDATDENQYESSNFVEETEKSVIQSEDQQQDKVAKDTPIEPMFPFDDEPDIETHELQETTSDVPQPQEIIHQGISFISGLAKTLQSPESTKELVDSIVQVDEKNGKTALHIPIPDKECVTNVLNMLGNLFNNNTK